MKRNAGFLLVMSCIVMVAGGCAKPEMPQTEVVVTNILATGETLKTRVDEDDVQKHAAAIELEEGIESVDPIPGAAELKPALERIYFTFDSYALSSEARNTLVKNARALKYDPEAKVRIEGHCDERGSDEYNLALGEKRARAAMQYLTTMGTRCYGGRRAARSIEAAS